MKFAAIDIGSNAVRLLLARVIEESDEPLLKKEVLVRMPLRLGDDAFREGRISADKAQRLAETMVGFRHLIRAYPALDFAAYATSAMREASNAAAVVERVRKQTGIGIEIIDGAREAGVIYANHVEHRLDPDRNYLYLDVGGGSTEVTLISHGRMVGSESFPLGGVRALRGKVSPKVIASLRQWVEQRRREHGSMVAIGSGGNINTIYKLARVKQGKPMEIERLRTMRNMLRGYSLEERIVTLNLRPDRADVVVFACDLYLSVMKWGRIRKIVVPQVGLADGIVHLLYNRHRRRRARSARGSR
ncbi:MAG TPA: exopolyphosphatase [Candidatus Krumholzibacteria bacterium]|nr:exopolyphosphatase [Candidatus Krumholzibacteria bacterium]